MADSPFGAYREDVEKHLFRYPRSGFAPALIVAAQGSWMRDADGREILDFGSGQMCATLGHNHPAIVEAIRQGCEGPIHLYSTFLSAPVIELATELAKLLPPHLQKVMLLSTGAESNEASLRLAKLATGGFEVLSLGGAWHGMTAGANAQTFAGGRRGFGPPQPGAFALPAPNAYRCPIRHCTDRCDMACLDVGFELWDQQSVGAGAAVLCEPILAAGGMIVPPDGWFARLREHCARRGLLLIFDEAQTGLGRTGAMFCFEHEGVAPDILNLSKTLGGGVALAATIASAELEEDAHEKGFHYYTSHVSDPLPARVGLAILQLIAEQDLVAHARAMGERLATGLRELANRHEAIGDVRGKGLLVGVELVRDRRTRKPHPELGKAAVKRAFELGLQSSLSGSARDPELGTVWKLAPPMTVSAAEIDLGLDLIDRALTDCAAVR